MISIVIQFSFFLTSSDSLRVLTSLRSAPDSAASHVVVKPPDADVETPDTEVEIHGAVLQKNSVN